MGKEMNRAVLLDRDGVINEDGSYLYRMEDIRFKEGIFEFCSTAQEKGYLLIVVTNQSGIARGFFSENDFLALTEWMTERFSEHGIFIQKVYYCPYHPQKGIGRYKVDSFDRKPNPGMVLKAKEEYELDLSKSILVGDKDSDMETGRRAGVGTLLLLPGAYRYTAAKDVTVLENLMEGIRCLS